jgi:hypothetical protein
MHQRAALALVVAALSAECARVRPALPGPSGEEGILRVDSAWARAYATNDTAVAQALFADELVVTSTNGSLKTRESELDDVRPAPGIRVDYFRTRDVRIHTYADAAVVIGRAEWRFHANEQVNQIAARYTAVYVRGGPLGWRMVALHMGRSP